MLISSEQGLDHIPVTDDLFRKALRRLQTSCSNHKVLPRSYFIPSESLSNQGSPFAAEDSADAHEAELDGEKVCVKTLKSQVQSEVRSLALYPRKV